MKEIKYDPEKVIFGWDKATLSLVNPNRGFLKYLAGQFSQLDDSPRKVKALDIGCGAGAITKALKRMFPNFDFWACDISKAAIKEAKRHSLGIHFFVADACQLPVEASQFDIVIMNSVLDHLKDPRLAVKKAFRVLKRKGIFLSTTPIESEPTTIHGLLTRFKAFRNHRLKHCGHIHAFTKKDLKTLVKKGGFKTEKVILDWFYFAQLVDVLYYPFLALLGKGPGFSLHRYSVKSKSFAAKAVKVIRALFTILENIESSLTLNIPIGFFAYVKAVKE